MNLQVERIEGHRAQLTVELSPDRFERAKRDAARKISRQVRIRGFRKGKAPYRRVAQTVGEAAIIEEAVEALTDELYTGALGQSRVMPVAPGQLDDVQLGPPPLFVFSAPLPPQVDLGDYLSVRVDYEEPQVEESDVDDLLKRAQQQAIETLDDSLRVTAEGNRVRVAMESEFVDGEAPLAEGEVDEGGPDAPYVPRKGDAFVNEKNATFILDPNDDPFMDGFVEMLLDCELGSDVVFELTIPDDDAEESLHGRRVEFVVTINQIEAISIPELDDEFARKAAESEGENYATMAEMRDHVRDNLHRAAVNNARRAYAVEALGEMVKGSEIQYADATLEQQIDASVEEFKMSLGRQGIKFEDYLRATGGDESGIRDQHRERAGEMLKSRLVAQEVGAAHGVAVTDEAIDMRLDATMAQYGDDSRMREIFESPRMRESVANDIYGRHVDELLFTIGSGGDPAQAAASVHDELLEERERAQRRAAAARGGG